MTGKDQSRIDSWMSSPAGCAFLLTSQSLHIRIRDLVQPLFSFHVAARAMSGVSIWRGDHAATIRQTLMEAAALRPLAQEILDHEETKWWFEPLKRGSQWWVSPEAGDVTLSRFSTSKWPATEQECYAQRPMWGLMTSTEVGGLTSLLATIAQGGSDLTDGLVAPLACFRLKPFESARVFEIDGPTAWHRLCVNYPAAEPGGLKGGLLVPDFGSVAREWDAVHLSFGGMLTADQVSVSSASGKTALQGWDVEQTIWLRAVFDSVERLPDIQEHPISPPELR